MAAMLVHPVIKLTKRYLLLLCASAFAWSAFGASNYWPQFRGPDATAVATDVSWRRGRSGRPYVHVEPHARSRQALRGRIGEELNHWTQWRSVNEAVARVNRAVRGWAGYYHYQHSARAFGKMGWWIRDRLRRWLWRKHACRRALWTDYPDEKLYDYYGLWRLPGSAKLA